MDYELEKILAKIALDSHKKRNSGYAKYSESVYQSGYLQLNQLLKKNNMETVNINDVLINIQNKIAECGERETFKRDSLEKINIEELGELVTKMRDGVPFSAVIDPMTACKEVAEKLNEVIELLTNKKE